MHAVSHSLSHRGPSATRARGRWQPYSAVTLSSNVSTPTRAPIAYLHTPATVTSSPPTAFFHTACGPDRIRAPSPQPLRTAPSRDASKTRYAIRLVDQAVRSLCDSWHPEDIPLVFTTPSPSLNPVEQNIEPPEERGRRVDPTLFPGRNTQLPSPVSPSTQLSPPTHDSSETPSQRCVSSVNLNQPPLPIKGFVHEVLRRSRTSTGVLQTALCYLEAVRRKVPEILRKEQMSPVIGSEDADMVYEATEDCSSHIDDGAYQRNCSSGQPAISESGLDTVSIADDHPHTSLGPQTPPLSQDGSAYTSTISVQDSTPRCKNLPPLPPLPSPLLCPRRTFLACLILASKFLQDRSYSNRAWAKLAGLHPREIGRCERALGDALEWRLWVGKDLHITANSRGGGNLVRSRSDNYLAFGNSVSPNTTCPMSNHDVFGAPTGLHAAGYTEDSHVTAPTPIRPLTHRSLRRFPTVPGVQTRTTRDGFANAPLFMPQSIGTSSLFEASAPFYEGNRRIIYTEPSDDSAAESVTSPSASISTPPLSFSPMSTSSTSSDNMDERTVQMTAIPDLPISSPSPHVPAACVRNWTDLASTPWVLALQSKTPGPAFANTPEASFSSEYRLAAFNPVMAGCASHRLPSLSDTLLLGSL